METFSVKQVQGILHLSERTIFTLIKNGELTGFKAGREWRFEQKDIDAYVERRRKKAEEELRGKRPTQSRISAVDKEAA